MVCADPATITIAGTDVEKKTADVSFDPVHWSVQWASGPPITARISNIDDHAVGDVNPLTIRLMGTVEISPGSDSVVNGVLTVQFDGSQAVQSLGTLVPGRRVYPRVQGSFYSSPNHVFSGQGHVDIVEAIVVDIDIKPGSFPNSINLGVGGKVPIAIFNMKNFDATSMDLTSVTLKGNQSNKRSTCPPTGSKKDVNRDGRQDLVLHFETQCLQLTQQDTEGFLEGKTYDGITIIGRDSVNIIQ